MKGQQENIRVTGQYIELYKLLKKENLVASGGEGKFVISEGLVRVNGKIETRKRKKIMPGDVVSFNGSILNVCADKP